MSKARKCDRCGKLFEGYTKPNGLKKESGYNRIKIETEGITYDRNFSTITYDLCEECNKELQEWLKDNVSFDGSVNQFIKSFGKAIDDCCKALCVMDVYFYKCIELSKKYTKNEKSKDEYDELINQIENCKPLPKC